MLAPPPSCPAVFRRHPVVQRTRRAVATACPKRVHILINPWPARRRPSYVITVVVAGLRGRVRAHARSSRLPGCAINGHCGRDAPLLLPQLGHPLRAGSLFMETARPLGFLQGAGSDHWPAVQYTHCIRMRGTRSNLASTQHEVPHRPGPYLQG